MPTPRILSMDEVVAAHAGEWVLMKVTDYEDGWPSRGEIIAHSTSRETVAKLRAELPSLSREPDARYALFEALRYIRTGAELRQALEEARRTGAKGAWRTW